MISPKVTTRVPGGVVTFVQFSGRSWSTQAGAPIGHGPRAEPEERDFKHEIAPKSAAILPVLLRRRTEPVRGVFTVEGVMPAA
jgi:hypothetical protein